MKTYKLHLIRHGLTEGNLGGVYVGGGLDQPLAPEGEQQLRQMSRKYNYPPAEVLFSSPMLRAIQSAEILYPHAKEKIILEDLREYRFGEFEGKSVRELMQNPRYKDLLDPKSPLVPEGGESGQEFAQRTARGLLTMMEHLAKNGIAQAVCVAHGGVIMSMLAQLATPQRPYPQWMSDNGAGFTVQASAAMLMRDGMVEATAIVPEGYLDNRQR